MEHYEYYFQTVESLLKFQIRKWYNVVYSTCADVVGYKIMNYFMKFSNTSRAQEQEVSVRPSLRNSKCKYQLSPCISERGY